MTMGGFDGFNSFAASEEHKVHNMEMTAGADSLRVMHEAAPRRSRNARLAIAGATGATIVVLATLSAL